MYFPLKKVSDFGYQGLVMPIDTALKNSNRIYTFEEVSNAISKLNLTNDDPLLGELGENPNNHIVDLSKVSHKITRFEISNSYFTDSYFLAVSITTLKTPSGTILKSLLDANAKIYLKGRGFGRVDKHNIVHDLEFTTFDAVKYIKN